MLEVPVSQEMTSISWIRILKEDEGNGGVANVKVVTAFNLRKEFMNDAKKENGKGYEWLEHRLIDNKFAQNGFEKSRD